MAKPRRKPAPRAAATPAVGPGAAAKPAVGPRQSSRKGTGKPSAPVILQPSTARRLYAGVFGVAFFILLVANATVARSIHLSVVPLVLVMVCCLGCVRLFRLAVIADERGLVVRNYLRSHRLAWTDVAEFRLEPPVARIDGWEITVVRTRAGPSGTDQIIRLDAAKRSLRMGDPDKERACLEPTVRQLNSWLRYGVKAAPGPGTPAVPGTPDPPTGV